MNQVHETIERLRQALDAAQVGTFLYHVQEDRGEPDARMLLLFGLPPAGTFSLAALYETIHPDDRAGYAQAMARATDSLGCGALRHEMRVVYPDRSVHWVEVASQTVFKGPERQASEIWGAAFNISERKQSEQNTAFLAEVSHVLVQMHGTAEAMGLLGEKIGSYFDADFCTFAKVDPKMNTMEVIANWQRPGANSLDRISEDVREHMLVQLALGTVYATPTLATASRLSAGYRSLGELKYVITIADAAARHWLPPEIALFGELGVRVGARLERIRTEEALRQSEDLRRIVMDNVPALISYFDTDLRYRFANHEYAEWFQTLGKNPMGRTVREMAGAEAFERVRPKIERALAGDVVGFEVYMPFKDGRGRHASFTYVPHKAPDGTVQGVVALIQDVTERKHTELLRILRNVGLELAVRDTPLAESLTELVSTMEMLSAREVRGSVLLMDSDGVHLRLGAAPSLPASYNAAMDGIAIAQEFDPCGAAAHLKEPVYSGDVESEPRWANFKALARTCGIRACWCVPVVSGQNETLGTLALYHREPRRPEAEDIELLEFMSRLVGLIIEQKRTGAALKNSRARLQQVFSQAPVAICVFRSRDYVIELANEPFQTLLQKRDMVGRRLAEVAPELEQAVWDAFAGVMNSGEPFVRNELAIRYDGNGDGSLEDHWFNVVYHPLKEETGNVSGIVAVFSEVTAQVVARRALERANRELEEFAYVASHDLQEPLRMVNIYAELLAKKVLPHHPEAGEHVSRIQRGVKRMDTLIRDLLTYSRTAQKDSEIPVGVGDLATAAQEALSVLQDRIEESGATVHVPPSLPMVRGETSQLSHVLQNLLSNAVKYRKPGVAPDIVIVAYQEGGEWIISVSDNGIGFEQCYAEQIFGLFKRLHSTEYSGTGLGLAICRRTVERYGGRMWAESSVGIGSTFSFSLPAVATNIRGSSEELPVV